MSLIIGKFKIEWFSLEFSNYSVSDAREKNTDFLVEYSFTSAVLSIEILTEEIKLIVVEN